MRRASSEGTVEATPAENPEWRSQMVHSPRTADPQVGARLAWRMPRRAGARGMCGRGALATAITAGTLAALAAAPAAAIVGGDPAPAGRWPWIVAILDADNSDPFMAQYCGGAGFSAPPAAPPGPPAFGKQTRGGGGGGGGPRA